MELRLLFIYFVALLSAGNRALSAAADEPCTACVYFYLLDVQSLPYSLSITEDQCKQFTNTVVSDIRAQAEAIGALFLDDADPVPTCEATVAKVCVAFRSMKDGALLQPWIYDQVQIWYEVALGGEQCPPYLAGYAAFVLVGGDGDDFQNLPASCLDAIYFPMDCDVRPPTKFPNCKCQSRQPTSTPFAVGPILDTLPGRKNHTNLYCFNIGVVTPYNPYSKCGSSASLSKAEISGNYELRHGFEGVGLQPAGSPTMRFVRPSWGAPVDNAIKVSALNWSKQQADGAKICLELKKDVHLNEFCMFGQNTCWISLFNDSKDCCPTYSGTALSQQS